MALKRKSKTMSILLTLAMLFMLWPGVVLAADPDPVVYVTDEDQLRSTVGVGSEVYANYTISIDQNITLTAPLTIRQDVVLTSVASTVYAGANKITIDADVTFNGDLKVTGTASSVVDVKNGASFTLDGNASVEQTNTEYIRPAISNDDGEDGTVIIKGGCTVTSSGLGIRHNKGSLTVEDGTICSAKNAITGFGNLSIKSGTIKSTNTTEAGIEISGIASICGGDIESNKHAVKVLTDATVNISGGNFTGSTSALFCNGTANLTGGNFTGKVQTSTGGTLNITCSTIGLGFSEVYYYNQANYNEKFIAALPEPVSDAEVDKYQNIFSTGTVPTYSLDETSEKLGANISNGEVTIDPSAGGTYDLVLTATVEYDQKQQTLKLTIPVTVTGPVSIPDIQGVTPPVTGEIPVTSTTETAQYTGTVSWSPAIVGNKFSPETAYTATITLAPKTGCILTGVAENFFTVAGATATNDAGSGKVTAVFPATAVQKADGPAAPAAPTLASKTHNSVTLTANLAHQFSKDNGQTWQDSNVFTGLSASTQYTFVARVKETATSNPSSASTGLSVTTNAAPSSGSSSSGGGGGTTPSGVLVTSDGQDTSDGGVTLNFPPGAVESDIRVQVREASLTSGMDLPADSQLISQVVDIVKNKSGDFSEPVTITMSFNKSQIDPDKYDIKICYFDEENGEWVELDNIEVDPANGSISGEVTHFTKFAVIATLKASEKEEPPLPPAPQPEPELPADLAGHWAKDSIAKLINARVISGYPDGSFQPDKTISRAEFTVMLVKALQLEPKATSAFKDTAAHWARESISTAAAHGLISGYDQNTFRPDDNITREQAAVIIARAAKLQAEDQKLSFSDVQQIAPWALSGVAAAVSKSYLSGYPDNSFRPQGNTTRAEAAAIIAKLLKN